MQTYPPSRRAALFAGNCLIIAVVAVADYVTGYEVRTYPLYFVPIAYGSWRLSRNLAMCLPALSAVGWLLSNLAAGGSYSSWWIWVFNFISQLLAFGLVAYLITELRRRLRIEQMLSREDALTSLPNRRAFFEQAALLVAMARRSGTPFTFAYLDLDDFKLVNDRNGHQEGDLALKTTAEILRRHSRETDLVARLGGDEFAMLIPETDPEAVLRMLERLRGLVATAMRMRNWPITVSVGALCYVRAPASLEEAVHRADALMYRAKCGGKDRVHLEVAGQVSSSSPAVQDHGLAESSHRA